MASEEGDFKITKKSILASLLLLISLIYLTNFTHHLKIETTNSIIVHFDQQMAEDRQFRLLQESEEATKLRQQMRKTRQYNLYKRFHEEKLNFGNYRLKIPFKF